MVHTRVHVLFVPVHAHALPLDAISCTSSTVNRNNTLTALAGCHDLRDRVGSSRSI